MLETNPYRPGTLHVYEVPFVNLKGSKPRLVLITSLPNSKGDVLGIPGSSQLSQWQAEQHVIINPEDVLLGELKNPTVFPISKQMVFSPRFFTGEIGEVNLEMMEKIQRLILRNQVMQFQASVRQSPSFTPSRTTVPPSGTPFPLKNRRFWDASNCTSLKACHHCFPNRLATSCTTSTPCPWIKNDDFRAGRE